jgi:hypothetical protein
MNLARRNILWLWTTGEVGIWYTEAYIFTDVHIHWQIQIILKIIHDNHKVIQG